MYEGKSNVSAQELRLQRLVLTFGADGLETRVLYKRQASDAPQPGAARRRREVTQLAREGLRQALEALERLDAPHLGSSYLCTSCGCFHISSRRFVLTRGKGRGKRRRKFLRDVG